MNLILSAKWNQYKAIKRIQTLLGRLFVPNHEMSSLLPSEVQTTLIHSYQAT